MAWLEKIGVGAAGVVLILVVIWMFGLARYDAGRLAERADWNARKAADTKVAMTTKARTDIRNAVATQESSDDIKGKLVDALAAANARPPRVCRSAPAADNMPGTATAAAGTADASEAAELATEKDDDAIAAENTIKAQGWLDWWTKIRGIQSDDSAGN